MKPKTIALLAVVVLFVIILFQNSDRTYVELFFWSVQMPLFLLIVSSIFLGWVVGWFTHLAYFKGKNKRGSAKTPKVEKTTGNDDVGKKEAEKNETSAEAK